MAGETLLVLAGDVMTGRGVDQILPEPGVPRLLEQYVVDARSYVALAERAHGAIPKPVDARWPWGEALAAMEQAGPGVRIMNLETSVTTSAHYAAHKGIHYRMSPRNVACLAAAGVDVWALANNHVLDHGAPGLLETLSTLHGARQRTAGAGAGDVQAWTPAVVSNGRTAVVVCSVAHVSSGVPPSWAAARHRPGVALLPDLSRATAQFLGGILKDAVPGDATRVVSVHWGGNWGYDVPGEHRRFAHWLVDAGADVVHGHSSHHPRPVEVYRDRLILYGCGDLVNDYEGISGYDEFRDDLRLLYLARLDPETGGLLQLTMVPFQARKMRLWRAAEDDARWLAERLDGACRGFGTGVAWSDDGGLVLRRTDGPGR